MQNWLIQEGNPLDTRSAQAGTWAFLFCASLSSHLRRGGESVQHAVHGVDCTHTGPERRSSFHFRRVLSLLFLRHVLHAQSGRPHFDVAGTTPSAEHQPYKQAGSGGAHIHQFRAYELAIGSAFSFPAGMSSSSSDHDVDYILWRNVKHVVT